MTGKEIPKETIGPKVNSSKTCPNYHSQYLFLVLHTRPRMSTVFTYFPLSFSLTCSLLRSRLTTASPGQGLSRRPAPRRLSGQTGMDIITDNGKMRAVTHRGCVRHFLMIYKCIMCAKIIHFAVRVRTTFLLVLGSDYWDKSVSIPDYWC